MGSSQGASTSHFFSFATAIDKGMTSINQPRCLNPGINVFKPTVMSWSQPSRSANIANPNCDLSKPPPTFRTQPRRLEPSANVSKPTSGGNMVDPVPPCPRPRPRPKPIAKNPNGNAGPSSLTPKPTSSLEAGTRRPNTIEDEDEYFMKNRNHSSKTWQKPEQITKGA